MSTEAQSRRVWLDVLRLSYKVSYSAVGYEIMTQQQKYTGLRSLALNY